MNNRHVAGGTLLTYPTASETTHRIGKWSRSIAVILILTFMGMISPGSSLAEDQGSGTNSPDDTGIQVGSWLLTVPYCVGKSAFAVAGSVGGGLGYVFSGGNSKTAEAIWATSVYGTYILRPAHLKGEEPIQFFGKADGDGSTPALHPAKHASVTSAPTSK